MATTLYHLLLTSCVALQITPSTAMAVIQAAPSSPRALICTDAPTIAIPAAAAPPPTSRGRFRIRRTRASDLGAVSTMLAEESVPRDASGWNAGVRRLRAKSDLEKQLLRRLAALDEGRDTARRLRERIAMENGDDGDEYAAAWSLLPQDRACQFLWTCENFRSKVMQAVACSHEENAWTTHNFDLTPSAEMLNHAMMTVEDTSSRDVVGFCEVAWLPSPALAEDSYSGTQSYVDVSALDIPQSYCEETDDSYCEVPRWQSGTTAEENDSYQQWNEDLFAGDCCRFAPAIVNLVTSPAHRRMGIATRMLNFASKYTTTQWFRLSCGGGMQSSSWGTAAPLGLYVRPENESALMLYTRKGFSVVSSDSADGLLYMVQTR